MKWCALALTLGLWAATWPQVLPSYADLPPCHMMVLIALAGAWTLYEFVQDRRGRDAEARLFRSGCCPRCGYNLTGNVSGICPECGSNLGNSDSAERSKQST